MTPVHYCRGAIDYVQIEGEEIRLGGWLMHPRIPLSRVAIAVDGETLGAVDIEARPDVADVFAIIPHAGQVGFRLAARLPSSIGHPTEVTVSSEANPGIVRYRALLPATTGDRISPPAELMMRVSGTSDPAVFHAVGRQVAADFGRAAVEAFGPAPSLSILDWGCGCGRVTPYLESELPGGAITGSDIDSEAISWCASQFPQIDFRTQSTRPPLPFDSSSFDLVLASSVLTHLDADHQAAWIPEIARILKPNGRLIASTHGRFAGEFFPGLPFSLKQHGIVDWIRDGALDAICPATYYRGVFQTPEYTEAALGAAFQLESYTEAGLGGFQDLFVARRRKP